MDSLLQTNRIIGKDIAWIEELRQQGRSSFVMPTGKTEDWKYTKLHELAGTKFEIEPKAKIVFKKSANCSCMPTNLSDCYKLYFFNGVFEPAVSSLPDGVEVTPLTEALLFNENLSQYVGKIAKLNHPFVALNTAHLSEGSYIKIGKNIKLDKPILIEYHTLSQDQNLFYNLRNVIVLEAGSQAQIVEHFHYEGDEKSKYFVNVVNEIYVEEGAKCTHYKLQQDSFKSIHISNTAVKVKSCGEYTKFCIQTGADIGRDETNVCLAEQKAKTQIYGIYKMSGWATVDFTSNIEHMVADTHSQEIVKGVADGHSRGVFQAGVYIAKNAVNTDAKQLHKGILLSDDAEVDAKPQLKIYADDVKCSHGSAMGELDKDQLFYLCSRGIDEQQAKKILIDAFLQDMFTYVENEQIKQWFSKNV